MEFRIKSAAQMILAAFCFVTAIMIWKIGDVLVYYGATNWIFVSIICTLFVTSGLYFMVEYEEVKK